MDGPPLRVGVAIAGAVALAAVFTAAVLVPVDAVLVVERTDTGEPVLTQSVTEGTTVALEYTHSVERSRVYDEYAVDGEALKATRMEFESYGWGLPAGANVTREDGTFVYDPPGSYRQLSVSPGSIAGHNLHVGDRTYDLVERSGGRSVTITVERRTVLEAIV